MTAASCKKNCVQNILMWLSDRGVKTQLQIVLIRLFAATDGYPISVKNEFFFKNIYIYFFFKCNRTIGSRSIGHRVWSMSLELSEN